MVRLPFQTKEDFWAAGDRRKSSPARAKLQAWDATVEEIGTGADLGKVKVRLPGEVTPLTDLPFAPVIGPMPALTDQVLTVADAASRRVITGETAAAPTAEGIFACYRSTTFTFAATATWTKLIYDVEQLDTDGWFVAGTGATQSRYTPQVAGWYQFSANIEISSPVVDQRRYLLAVGKNGNVSPQPDYYMDQQMTSGTSIQGLNGTTNLAQANGTTDYFEVFSHQNETANKTYTGGQHCFWWTGRLVKAT